MKFNIKIFVILLFIFTVIFSCARLVDHIVRDSGKKGAWVDNDETFWVENERMFFRVMSTDEVDLTSALDGLDGEAYEDVINLVKMRVGREFDDAMVGSKFERETIQHVRQNVVNAIGDVEFAGLAKNKVYWEYWKIFPSQDPDKVKLSYFIWALYSLPEEEYNLAKERAWKNADEEANNEDAKKLLKEAKKRFLERK